MTHQIRNVNTNLEAASVVGTWQEGMNGYPNLAARFSQDWRGRNSSVGGRPMLGILVAGIVPGNTTQPAPDGGTWPAQTVTNSSYRTPYGWS
jgi:hypothetical protein